MPTKRLARRFTSNPTMLTGFLTKKKVTYLACIWPSVRIVAKPNLSLHKAFQKLSSKPTALKAVHCRCMRRSTQVGDNAVCQNAPQCTGGHSLIWFFIWF
mmetsp:Transcript_96801/g.159409  ORF Transcript_96801/g.159409 Transcript_96801/m.159409 type:complete len:100 (-) Transcript_96801:10-309(-)